MQTKCKSEKAAGKRGRGVKSIYNLFFSSSFERQFDANAPKNPRVSGEVIFFIVIGTQINLAHACAYVCNGTRGESNSQMLAVVFALVLAKANGKHKRPPTRTHTTVLHTVQQNPLDSHVQNDNQVGRLDNTNNLYCNQIIKIYFILFLFSSQRARALYFGAWAVSNTKHTQWHENYVESYFR